MKYFTEKDFKKCVPSCSMSDMDSSFMAHLDAAREIAGCAFVLNSAYRSVEYELDHGRAGTSSHTKGIAVDIRCNNGYRRLSIINALLKIGFGRIGIHKNFIHVDADFDKPDSIWLY